MRPLTLLTKIGLVLGGGALAFIGCGGGGGSSSNTTKSVTGTMSLTLDGQTYQSSKAVAQWVTNSQLGMRLFVTTGDANTNLNVAILSNHVVAGTTQTTGITGDSPVIVTVTQSSLGNGLYSYPDTAGKATGSVTITGFAAGSGPSNPGRITGTFNALVADKQGGAAHTLANGSFDAPIVNTVLTAVSSDPGGGSGSTATTASYANSAIAKQMLQILDARGIKYRFTSGTGDTGTAPDVINGFGIGAGACIRDTYIAAAFVAAWQAEESAHEGNAGGANQASQQMLANLGNAGQGCSHTPTIGDPQGCVTDSIVTCDQLKTWGQAPNF